MTNVTAPGTLRDLFHYPVKGLSAQRLEEVALETGRGFPWDRAFGLARHNSGFDPAEPRPLDKTRFMMLVREERLAGLDTRFDPASGRLVIAVRGREVLNADTGSAAGRQQIERFFATMHDLNEKEAPIFASAGEHRFTDVSVVSPELMNAVSFINLDSVAAFSQAIGRPVDPARFRANVLFDGWPAYSELDMVGREFTIGDARMRFVLRTRRCAATEVNPTTVRRDLPVPRLLHAELGHPDMGVYAVVVAPGRVRPGDTMALLPVEERRAA